MNKGLKSLLGYGFTALAFTGIGMLAANSELAHQVNGAAKSAKQQVLTTVAASVADGDVRKRVLIENPELIRRVMEGGAFGGDFSQAVAQNMFSKDHRPAIDDAIDLVSIEAVGDRQWVIHLPIVNSILFETDEGLVVVDTGMAPAGPALLKAIRRVSDKPIHTIILSHGHVDHAYGTYALIADSPKARVIAQENITPRFERYIKLRGSLAHYMSQPEHQLPQSDADIVWPTETFRNRMELIIGGEEFVLQHHRGETDDQLYVWLPGRKALASADYYQGFLPNAGNGKRVQRYVEDWAVALREMAALKAEFLLPSHGAPMQDTAKIADDFTVLAQVLETISAQTLAGLNQGQRKDQIFQSIVLPQALANHPTMTEQYVSAKDISKMVLKQYTGWWNDMPSDWSPASKESQGAQIVALAGGIDPLVAHTRRLLVDDVVMACHFADWAFLAEPNNPQVQQLVLDVYKARILDPATNTQEMLTYIDQMALARQQQLLSGL